MRRLAGRRAISACSSPRSRPARIPMPVSPGQHRLRPRRPHYRSADAVAQPGDCPRGARLSRRRNRRQKSTRPRMPSRAKSCTRCAAARWRRLGEVPFRRYYGSVDATPLFVMLAGAYLERTGDVAIAPSALAECRGGAGLDDGPGDRDGDGFIEYHAHDGVGTGQSRLEGFARFHLPRRRHLGRGPIALCEVQGYVYAAKRAGAPLRAAWANSERARTLDAAGGAACATPSRSAFWCDDSAPMRWRWTARSRPARSAPPMPDMC